MELHERMELDGKDVKDLINFDQIGVILIDRS